MIYGEVVQRWQQARGAVLRKWPVKQLETYGGWFLFSLFYAILVWEEVWNLENTAYLSSWLLLLITTGAMVGSALFERRVWCRYLCPIGGMNGLYSKLALTEIRASKGVCDSECDTYHCYKGGPAEGKGQATNGCPLHTHPASLKDNRDCVLCMTCLKACPHESVQLNLRAPGVDFGYPFLFPVPGTSSAPQHQPYAHEVALLFLLMGANVCHHIPEVLRQLGWDADSISHALHDKGSHIALSLAALAAPGVIIFLFDSFAQLIHKLLYPRSLAPRNFIDISYAYLPLVWLGSLAHYEDLGLTEAGRVLPLMAKTAHYFLPDLGSLIRPVGELLTTVENKAPTLTASNDVVAFLQGSTLLAGVAMSSLLLQKLGRQHWSAWMHQALMLLLTAEYWSIIIN